MRRWWSLVGKEWRNSWTVILLSLAATVAFDAWLAVKAPEWSAKIDGGLPFGLSFIPFVGVGIAAAVVGYYTMRNEWRDRTSLRLLSYPVSGTEILWAKLVRSSMPYSAMISTTGDILRLKPWERALDITWMVVCLILGASFIIAVGMFSFVIGTIVPRISGLIAVIVYGLTWYLTFAFAPHAMYLFSFVPNPGLIVYAGAGLMAPRHVIPLLPFWPTLAATVILILVAGKILESEVDA